MPKIIQAIPNIPKIIQSIPILDEQIINIPPIKVNSTNKIQARCELLLYFNRFHSAALERRPSKSSSNYTSDNDSIFYPTSGTVKLPKRKRKKNSSHQRILSSHLKHNQSSSVRISSTCYFKFKFIYLQFLWHRSTSSTLGTHRSWLAEVVQLTSKHSSTIHLHSETRTRMFEYYSRRVPFCIDFSSRLR